MYIASSTLGPAPHPLLFRCRAKHSQLSARRVLQLGSGRRALKRREPREDGDAMDLFPGS
ncbi:hypothetical protein EJ06DRAFT_531864 [Trichodelitschia bisporula]|uniref:Uncharacterized protein n=1 Tax=Trichodelitschia bisporula TaxID=703511 RepID=A0A6G1HRY5_9PEZI|nr:hypothetical protein EJ06DRAFT_531864 [Trichodelitschia bisporula]